MVTSSIKFWKAMEKFDVSRSLFLSKKFESWKFKSSRFKIQKLLYMNSHSTFKIIVYSLFSIFQIQKLSCHFERNEMKPRNLNQQFKLESLKVEGLKLLYMNSHSTFKIQNNSLSSLFYILNTNTSAVISTGAQRNGEISIK